MARVEKTVFISYRRTNVSWALAVYQNLTRNGFDVFFDYEDIGSGAFDKVILENIEARAHFVVLLTPSALAGCVDPDDWLRREIEFALQRERNIVPLMLEGFDFNSPTIRSQLTGKLAKLRRYNALEVPASYFDAAMERLRTERLHISLDAVLHPASIMAREAAVRNNNAARAAPVVPDKELTSTGIFEKAVGTKDPSAKRRYYDHAIRLKPDYAEAYNNRGNLLMREGQLEDALADYNHAVRLKPDYFKAYVNRGVTLHQLGDREAAIKDFNEAIRIAPGYAKAYYHRGITLKQQGRVDAALRDYTEAIRLKVDFAKAYNSRGITFFEQGDLDAALKDCTEAIRLRPNYAEAFNNRGTMRKQRGDLDGAISDYNEAIRLRRTYAEAFNNRGAALKLKGDLDGAVRDFNEAIRLNPAYADAYNDRGVVLHTRGDLDGALKDYNRATKLRPDSPRAYGNRARVWEQKADRSAALADLETYLQLGGGHLYGDQADVKIRIDELRGQA